MTQHVVDADVVTKSFINRKIMLRCARRLQAEHSDPARPRFALAGKWEYSVEEECGVENSPRLKRALSGVGWSDSQSPFLRRVWSASPPSLGTIF